MDKNSLDEMYKRLDRVVLYVTLGLALVLLVYLVGNIYLTFSIS